MAFQNAGISTASCPSPPEGGKTACLHEPRTGEGTLDRPEPLHNNGNVRRRTERFSQDDPVVTSRVRRIGTRAMAVVTLIFGIGILACTVGADDVNVGDVNLLLAIVIGITGMGIVGAVLSAKAPQNPLGPAYQVAAMFMALAVLASLYGERGLSDLPGLPLVPIAGWLTQLAFTPAFAATCTAFLLFPDGRPPSTRWRPVMWLIWGGAVVAAIGTTFGSPRFEFDPGSTVANPFRMGPEGLFVGLNILGGAASFLGGILAVIAVVVRFRRSKAEERQQLRWLAWAAGAILVCAVALVLAGLVGGDSGTAFELVFLALVISVLVGLPLATAIAVLRYRLYDLDLVVKKTAIYSIVAIALTALYLALLGGATLVGLGPIPAGVVFLLTFTFARNRARKIADRIVYGKRATPFEVLSEFSERVGETYSVDDVLPRMTQLLAAGTGAREARAWIRHGRTLRASAVAPADAGTMPDVELAHDESSVFGEDLYVFPVTHQGELLGAITLAMAANDPMDASKERLAQGVASQAGLALRNVRLVEDLRASRSRIVAAQDERAKALERNIHDGAQQQLVALTVRLRLAEQMAERDPAAVAAMLGDLRDQASAALEDLRDLARGVYPPLLADKGLFAAVEAQARKAAVPVEIQPGQLSRYPPAIESTVYFCVLEALNNVVKYADASGAVVSLAQTDGVLAFEVRDDGRGFDSTGSTYGTGLQGMADRLDAVGGGLLVRSSPGTGAVVRGEIPVLKSDAVEELPEK
jgi:signal transduction histidine kinase